MTFTQLKSNSIIFYSFKKMKKWNDQNEIKDELHTFVFVFFQDTDDNSSSN